VARQIVHVRLRNVDNRSAPGNGHPADTPRPVLNTWNLQKFSNGTVFDNELWGADRGVLR
jgi:hypothetical protein